MSTTQTITIDFSALVDFDAQAALEVEILPNGLFRIEEIPFGLGAPLEVDLQYRDIVELERNRDGTYELLAIRERGGWKRFDFLLPADYVDSDEMEKWLSDVEAAGGIWIREFGGCVTIMLPPDSRWDPNPSI